MSFKYIEKSVGLKIYPCFTPTLDENMHVSPSANLIEISNRK
jgi:hypothetical protein